MEFLPLSLSLLFLSLALLFFAFEVFLGQSFLAFALLELKVEGGARLEFVTDFESILELIHVLLFGQGSLVLISEVHLLVLATSFLQKFILQPLPLPVELGFDLLLIKLTLSP